MVHMKPNHLQMQGRHPSLNPNGNYCRNCAPIRGRKKKNAERSSHKRFSLGQEGDDDVESGDFLKHTLAAARSALGSSAIPSGILWGEYILEMTGCTIEKILSEMPGYGKGPFAALEDLKPRGAMRDCRDRKPVLWDSDRWFENYSNDRNTSSKLVVSM